MKLQGLRPVGGALTKGLVHTRLGAAVGLVDVLVALPGGIEGG